MKKSHYIAVAAALLISSTAWAGALTVPNTFSAGTPAVAADVNANFTAAKTAIDDNNTRITANTASAGTNTTDIATSTTNITANTASAATNTTDISANATAITTLQNAALVRTINVSPVIGGGGVIDAVASGTALINAVAGITGSSVTNQFTVKLEPGTYDLVAQTLTLPDGVNLEGSGQEVTTISSNGLTPVTVHPFPAAVVVLGSSVIRQVTLKELSNINFAVYEGTAALDIRAGTVLVENSTLFGSLPLINNSTATVKATFLNSRLTQPAGATSPVAYRVILSLNAQVSIDVISSEYGSVANQGALQATARCFSSYRSTFAATTANCN